MGLYLMKQFMNQVPDNIIESARIDGCGEFMIFMRIVMPMVKPAWLTLIIFAIQSLWNAPSGSFIYSEELKTRPTPCHRSLRRGFPGRESARRWRCWSCCFP